MFSDAVMDRVVDPRYEGPLESFTHHGVAGAPGDGPYLELWLDIEGGAIRRAAYRTYSCPAAVACGSMVAQLATGRSVEAMGRLTEADIDLLLGGLPAGKEHCPRLAIAALGKALRSAAGPGLPAGPEAPR